MLEHIVTIDKAANMQVKNIIKNLAKANNVDEMLKQSSPFEWVRLINNLKNSAEAIRNRCDIFIFIIYFFFHSYILTFFIF